MSDGQPPPARRDDGDVERQTVARLLAEPFPPAALKQLQRGGQMLTYVPVEEVEARLTRVLGVGRWGIEAEAWRDERDPEWVIARVRLTVRVGDDQVVVEQYGGQRIKRYGARHPLAGEIQDLGDDYKAAVSHALKRAARALGVGSDLARADDAIRAERDLEPADAEQIKTIQRMAAEAGVDLATALRRAEIAHLGELNRREAGAWIRRLHEARPKK